MILWSNESHQVMTLVTWVVMCHAGARSPKYLACNVINYLPYINVMIQLRLGNERPPIPIQSVPHRSAIPIWLTIDNKIVTCWIIMGLEVKSVLIVKRERECNLDRRNYRWPNNNINDLVIMDSPVNCNIFNQKYYHQKDSVILSLWESIKSSKILIKMIS